MLDVRLRLQSMVGRILPQVQEERGNRAAMEDIKGKLHEMTIICDRQRTQLLGRRRTGQEGTENEV